MTPADIESLRVRLTKERILAIREHWLNNLGQVSPEDEAWGNEQVALCDLAASAGELQRISEHTYELVLQRAESAERKLEEAEREIIALNGIIRVRTQAAEQRAASVLCKTCPDPWPKVDPRKAEPLPPDGWVSVRQELVDACKLLPVKLGARIQELAKQHGSLRAAARVLEIDHAYLWRLQQGDKTEPSKELLRKLKLRRVVTYIDRKDP